MDSLDIVCLGVGKGASCVMKGMPSTSFAVRLNGHPVLLVDCGAGIALSCHRHLGEIPSTIYVSHNHMDHTGDLPIAVGFTKTQPRLLGHPSVLQIVKEHRFHDGAEVQRNTIKTVEWIEPDKDGVIHLQDDLSIHLFQTIHSYICFGFVLKKDGKDILGYSADSAFSESIYKRITQSPIAIVDGRDQGNHDHASLSDIDQFGSLVSDCAIYVVHYETSNYMFRSPNVHFLAEGDIIPLPA